MKKVVSSVLVIAIAFLLVFSLCACNNANKIVGKWKFSNIDMSYGENTSGLLNFDLHCTQITFNSDGTVKNNYEETAFWRYDKKNKAYIIACAEKDFESNENYRTLSAFIDKNNVLHIEIFTYKKA